MTFIEILFVSDWIVDNANTRRVVNKETLAVLMRMIICYLRLICVPSRGGDTSTPVFLKSKNIAILTKILENIIFTTVFALSNRIAIFVDSLREFFIIVNVSIVQCFSFIKCLKAIDKVKFK